MVPCETMVRVFRLAFAGLLAASCAHRPAAPLPAPPRTCLVLSVGGPAGVAHIGAIKAVQEARIPIQCVVGNSMGALVGGLFASAPSEDPDARFQRLIADYMQETERDGRRGLANNAVYLTSGRAGVLRRIGLINYDRFHRTLRSFLGTLRIEELPVSFATFYGEGTTTGVTMQKVEGGILADELVRSIANPLIFPGLPIRAGSALDVGADRMSAVPVDDACKLFPGANLIVVNVTGESIVTTAGMKCPVREVRIDPPRIAPEEAFLPGPAHDRLVQLGLTATRDALAAVGTAMR